MDEIFPTLTPSNSTIRNENNYKHQANKDIYLQTYEMWKLDIIRMCNKSVKVVMFLLCWELIWECWLQAIFPTSMQTIAWTSRMSILVEVINKRSRFM